MRDIPLTAPLTISDADALSELAQRCVRECCEIDHGNAPALVDAWVATLTAPHVRALLLERGAFGAMVTSDSRMLGAAVLSRAGTLRLMCVAPEWHQRGLGRRLMSALEFEARRRWVSILTVRSTASAAGFFGAIGFEIGTRETNGRPNIEPPGPGGISTTPMWKALPR